jgi:hypothetical protein
VGEEKVEGQATSRERSGSNEDASLHPAGLDGRAQATRTDEPPDRRHSLCSLQESESASLERPSPWPRLARTAVGRKATPRVVQQSPRRHSARPSALVALL